MAGFHFNLTAPVADRRKLPARSAAWSMEEPSAGSAAATSDRQARWQPPCRHARTCAAPRSVGEQ